MSAKRDQREAHDQQQSDGEDRRLLPRQHLPAPRPEPKCDRSGNAQHERDRDRFKARTEDRPGEKQAAVVEKHAAGNRNAVAQDRKRLQHGVVPEQQLQQQRQIADHLDIAGGKLRHEHVFRQLQDADREAENGRANDPENRDQQRVQQANPEGAAIGRLRRIRDQMLADVEARGRIPEVESGRDACPRKILRGIGGGAIGEPDDNRAEQQLESDAAPARIVERRDFWRSGLRHHAPPQ